MASEKIQTEPITSEPVIVNKSDAQTNPATETESESKPEKTEEEVLKERIAKLEATLEAHHITSEDRPYREETTRIYTRARSRSRTPIRAGKIHPTQLNDSSGLAELLETPDSIAEIQSGPEYYQRSTIYVTNLSFHATELEKISWVFRLGFVDGWTRNVSERPRFPVYQAELPKAYRRHADCYVDDRYDERNERQCAIVKMGNALNVLDEEKEGSGVEKVKFLIAVQGKQATSWVKLLISHSRQSALVDIFHEILNGHSVVFVGAVLKDALIPVEGAVNDQIKFQKVDSVEEAEGCAEDVIGVIC